MRQFLVTLAGVFAGLVLFFVGVPFLIFTSLVAASRPAPTPANAVLSLDLRQSLPDQDPDSPFAFFTGRKLSVLSIVDGLREAASDPSVKALLIRLPEGGMAPAAADEIRDAVKRFRASGKPVIAHSQGIYPSGQPVATYMVGAASGGFWMQPQASLQATGAASEEMFFKRAFDKYGVKADYQQRYQYKTAVNPLLYSDYTAAHREEELGWMGSVYGSELAAAAQDRAMPLPTLRTALEGGPYIAQDALARKLIDRVGGVEEAEVELKRAAGFGAKLVDFNGYRASTRSRRTVRGDAIAVIGAEGAIVTGVSRNTGFSTSSDVRSDDLLRAFQKAADDPSVKAIVFRVSSPGGSDTASEEIGAAVRAAKARKPVVVSMGTYAASGGYWISADASEIVANPSTLTGSIGVFGGKFVLGPALARFGVDTHGLSVGGPYAASFGSGEPFTPAQQQAVSAWMDGIYAGFVNRVAQGRRLPPAQVEAVAKGRVWTGAQARDLRLVDRLGGFATAVAEAKRLAGLPASRAVTLKPITATESPFAAMGQSLGSARLGGAAGVLDGLADGPQGRMLLRAVDRARLIGAGQGAALADLPAF